MSVPRGRQPLLASRYVATAIVDVRFSMSTAPRPHTMPSTSSAANGSRCQPDRVTGTTSVCPMSRSVGALGSALDPRDQAHPSRLRGVALAGKAGAREEVLEGGHAALFVTGGGLAGIDAAV